ncbi:cache domain-containing sensor histidine kinase [Acetatifactor aquisgranensis]|uniref:cache domain-containing sensor histidine kinase n=1 Tax=Acetatifactor aquisgranensis TaxID=2941233 RepID=UPI002040A1A8|nr:histidine kinase [Acetatifactor aquisgranensis]
MSKLWESISLRKKVPLVFCTLLFVVIATMGATLFLYYHRAFQEYFRKSFNVMITANAHSVEEVLGSMVMAVDMVNDNEEAFITSDSKNMQSLANLIVNTVPKQDGSNLVYIKGELAMAKNNLAQQFYRASSYGLIVKDTYPLAQYFGRWSGFGRKGIFDDEGMEEDWYKETLEKDGELFWFTRQEAPNQLFMAKRLKYRYYNRNLNEYDIRDLGVMYAGLDLTSMDTWMDLSEMPEKVEIVILDAQGDILYSNREDAELLNKDNIGTAMENAAEDAAFYGDGKRGRYLLQGNEMAQGLYLLTAIPADVIDRMSLEMLSVLLLLLVAAVVTGMILVGIVSRSVTRPIIRLAGQMKLGITEPVEDEAPGGNEIRILYQGYNQMQKKIQEMIKDVWENAERRKEAELKTLQAQINPHFIYNTMGTISCEALLRGEDIIAKQLNMLASIMRYSTKNPDSLVPLRKEIQIIRQYADIQKLSRGVNMTFTYEIDPACEDILIPKLMIQPLVENAVIHGIDYTRKDGNIRISAKIEDESVVVAVADNGVGGDMEAINRYTRGEQSLDNDHDSLGVRNVYERICGVYGENGSLVYRRVGEDTEAVVTIMMKARGHVI